MIGANHAPTRNLRPPARSRNPLTQGHDLPTPSIELDPAAVVRHLKVSVVAVGKIQKTLTYRCMFGLHDVPS